jgi:hypothetical protein
MVITLAMVIIIPATETTLPMDITPQMLMTTTMDITPLKVMTQTIVMALHMVTVLPIIVMTTTIVMALHMVTVLPTIVMITTTHMALHMVTVLRTIAMIPTICITLHIAMTPPTDITPIMTTTLKDPAKLSSRFRNTPTGRSPIMMLTKTANLIRQRRRNSGTMLYPTTIPVNC